jgi:hypothetical protein
MCEIVGVDCTRRGGGGGGEVYPGDCAEVEIDGVGMGNTCDDGPGGVPGGDPRPGGGGTTHITVVTKPGSTPGILQTIKNDLCSATPQGRTTGVEGSFGGPGGGTGTFEIVTNYNTGEVSAIYSKGVYAGWNGGLEGQAFSGAIYNLGNSNSNYSGGFTTGSGSFGAVGGYVSQSSGGLSSNSVDPFPPAGAKPVRVVGGSVGWNVTGSLFTGQGSVTNYSNPVPLGRYWTIATNPVDLLGFIERQVCK